MENKPVLLNMSETRKHNGICDITYFLRDNANMTSLLLALHTRPLSLILFLDTNNFSGPLQESFFRKLSFMQEISSRRKWMLLVCQH